MREAWEDEDEPEILPAVNGIPPEARRIGLSRHTEEGALLEFASSLSATKPSHRMMAWLMLLVFTAPAVFLIVAVLL